ncbi:MAG: ATP-binding cassette domain-containing protein, partial [Rhizobacter sp.]|nr:ATP-binding cassette domain-containing protein [Rhizobacter sp.]
MAVLLETRGLNKSFGGRYATRDVNLAIDTGEIRCLIGPNGAGKSTLFKLISGTYRPDAGQVRFAGVDVTPFRPHRRINQGLS